MTRTPDPVITNDVVPVIPGTSLSCLVAAISMKSSGSQPSANVTARHWSAGCVVTLDNHRANGWITGSNCAIGSECRCFQHTRAEVDALKVIDGRRTEYTSTVVDGLILDCLPTGKRSWRLRYQVGIGRARKRRKFLIGNADNISLAAAEKKAREVLASVQVEGRDPQAEKVAPAGMTFGDVIAGWTSWQRNNGGEAGSATSERMSFTRGAPLE